MQCLWPFSTSLNIRKTGLLWNLLLNRKQGLSGEGIGQDPDLNTDRLFFQKKKSSHPKPFKFSIKPRSQKALDLINADLGEF